MTLKSPRVVLLLVLVAALGLAWLWRRGAEPPRRPPAVTNRATPADSFFDAPVVPQDHAGEKALIEAVAKDLGDAAKNIPLAPLVPPPPEIAAPRERPPAR